MTPTNLSDLGFEAFVRAFNLPAFVPIPRTCEVGNFGRSTLYKLNAQKKLTIRKLEGKSGVTSIELFSLLKNLPAA